MPRRAVGIRIAMAITGLVSLIFYLILALLLYRTVLFVWSFGLDPIMILAGVIAGTLLVGYLAYWLGPTRVVASLDAAPLPASRAPGLSRTLRSLCDRMDLSVPNIYLARLGLPNAFALSGPRPIIVIDGSLVRLLDPAELEAVLAHELAHLEGRDGLIQTLGYSLVQTAVGLPYLLMTPLFVIATGLARALALLRGRPDRWRDSRLVRIQFDIARAGSFVMLALLAVVRAYGRRRELAADDRAAEVTGRPLAMARALIKIHDRVDAGFPLGPASGDSNHPLLRLLTTHPPVDERVARLVKQADRSVSPESRSEDRWTRVRL